MASPLISTKTHAIHHNAHLSRSGGDEDIPIDFNNYKKSQFNQTLRSVAFKKSPPALPNMSPPILDTSEYKQITLGYFNSLRNEHPNHHHSHNSNSGSNNSHHQNGEPFTPQSGKGLSGGDMDEEDPNNVSFNRWGPEDQFQSAQQRNKSRKKVSCNCKKSRCLKLYCDCFSVGEFCRDCNCTGCANVEENEDERNATIVSIRERNPQAFKPKVVSLIILVPWH
jgi:hypothetical protein